MLGGDCEDIAASFHDRLHEPFRIADAPLLEALRSQPAQGSAGSTLSGSGPSVVVWASREAAAAVAAELAERFPEARILPLALAAHGAQASRGSAGPSGESLRASGAAMRAHA